MKVEGRRKLLFRRVLATASAMIAAGLVLIGVIAYRKANCRVIRDSNLLVGCYCEGYGLSDPEQQMQHLRVDGPPQEIAQLRLYLGVQPSAKDCPRGMYRPSGAGITIGECEFCPRGVYGDSPGLVSKDCSAKCPKGTYNDKLGAKSILDCKPCPAGVYGSTTGLTTSQCSGPCPRGRYSMTEGVQSLSDCMDCPENYRGPQGYRGNDVTMKNGGGYPCDRYLYGKTIVEGRDANNDAWLTGYLSEARNPTNNQVVDNTTP